MLFSRASRWVCALLLGACVCGCDSTARQRRQLASRYPPDRAQAIVRLAEAGDTQAVHTLVELLADDDRAVRMYAILALERLCGENYGYRYYDPPAEREAAIRRWRQALQDGLVVVHRPTAATGTNQRLEESPVPPPPTDGGDGEPPEQRSR